MLVAQIRLKFGVMNSWYLRAPRHCSWAHATGGVAWWDGSQGLRLSFGQRSHYIRCHGILKPKPSENTFRVHVVSVNFNKRYQQEWETFDDTYLFLEMGVSKNMGTPKSSILIGFPIINHPFWGTPIFGNTQIFLKMLESYFFRGRPSGLRWLSRSSMRWTVFCPAGPMQFLYEAASGHPKVSWSTF